VFERLRGSYILPAGKMLYS